MSAISTIRNLGPAFEKDCHDAGITSAEQLRELGGDAAYKMILMAGKRPHFIAYYVLHMGLQGRPWNDCQGDEKKALRKSFDAIVTETRVAETRGENDSDIERFLNEMGTGKRR